MTAEFFQLILPWALILLAMFTGTLLEKAHFKRIHEREAFLKKIPALSTRQIPAEHKIAKSALIMGDVVISIDYFKRFLASLRNIFGGEVKSYGSLLDRGRREAVIRMKEQGAGADLIVNLRIETSSVSQGGQKKMGSVEILAFGTALWYATESAFENN